MSSENEGKIMTATERPWTIRFNERNEGWPEVQGADGSLVFRSARLDDAMLVIKLVNSQDEACQLLRDSADALDYAKDGWTAEPEVYGEIESLIAKIGKFLAPAQPGIADLERLQALFAPAQSDPLAEKMADALRCMLGYTTRWDVGSLIYDAACRALAAYKERQK